MLHAATVYNNQAGLAEPDCPAAAAASECCNTTQRYTNCKPQPRLPADCFCLPAVMMLVRRSSCRCSKYRDQINCRCRNEEKSGSGNLKNTRYSSECHNRFHKRTVSATCVHVCMSLKPNLGINFLRLMGVHLDAHGAARHVADFRPTRSSSGPYLTLLAVLPLTRL